MFYLKKRNNIEAGVRFDFSGDFASSRKNGGVMRSEIGGGVILFISGVISFFSFRRWKRESDLMARCFCQVFLEDSAKSLERFGCQ